ncbi:hypothetical protein Tco_0780332 [Tanacetum coccineum]
MEDDSDEDDLDKQPLSKRFKIMTPIPNPIPLNTFVPEHLLKPEEQQKPQAQKWTEHEAKKAKMMEEYKHQISFRADQLPIIKISYVVNPNKEATMKITRGDNHLNLVVHPNFRLKTLGFSEWLEVHALASKKSGKSNDMLLQEKENDIDYGRDVMKGLFECKASESNIKHIRVKDIVKKVKDYLKTYPLARMDIIWHETQYLLKARQKAIELFVPSTKELTRKVNGSVCGQLGYSVAGRVDNLSAGIKSVIA